jgi:Zn-dependent protease
VQPCWRHPFDVAPYVGAACLPAGSLPLRLEEHERALIRRLWPETAAMWSVTAGSALLSIALYCGIWDVPIAVGLVLGMWIHELGHAAALRKLGLETGPIVFVPFIGAVQRLRVWPARALDIALLSLAGPGAGLAFALVCKLGYALTEQPALRFLATAHAALAVIDLLPLGTLDGARVVAVLNRRDRAVCASATCLVAITGQFLVLVPMCLALAWTCMRIPASEGQPAVAAAILGLLGCACWLV